MEWARDRLNALFATRQPHPENGRADAAQAGHHPATGININGDWCTVNCGEIHFHF